MGVGLRPLCPHLTL